MNPPAYIEFARVLEGAETGQSLFEALQDGFPQIRRADAFLGIALALSALKADLLAAEIEATALRRQLEQRRAA